MFTAIVWIGKFGSWSKGGFATEQAALRAASDYALSGALADRGDVEIDCKGPGAVAA